MSNTIKNALNQAFDPTPALFSRRMTSTLRSLPPRRTPLHWRRWALALSVPALAAVGIALAWQGGTHPVDRTNQSPSLAASAAASAGDGNGVVGVITQQNEDVFNILLLGVDTREAETFSNARSDTVMLLSVDTKNKTIKLTSFLRDIPVDTGAGEKSRLNATMADGGPHSVQQALQDNFGVQTDKYAVVNFWTFADIIDTLGGVEVDVQPVTVGEMNRCIQELNGLAGGKKADEIAQAGMQHLNGRQTVAYLRVRHVGEFGRAERQQAVLDQLIARMSSLSLDQVTQIAKELPALTQSDLSPGYILDMAAKLYAVRGTPVQQMTIPVEGSYRNEQVDGMAVLTVDFERNRQALQDFLGADATPASPDATLPADAQAFVSVESPVKNTAVGRLENIRLACAAIDGTVIGPGETMSFNALVGEPTAGKGYRPAQGVNENGIIVGTKVGGGIDQVATALYDAAACADMQIVERHPNAMPAAYVRSGQEAMVDYVRGKDLAFRNTLDAPVQVSLVLTKFDDGKWTLACSLLSTARLDHTVKLESTGESIPAPKPDTVTYYAMEQVARGDNWVILYRDGLIARTDKVTTAADGTQKRELFTTDTYPARGTIVCYNPADPKPTALPTANP